jgi:hypothetical protein
LANDLDAALAWAAEAHDAAITRSTNAIEREFLVRARGALDTEPPEA